METKRTKAIIIMSFFAALIILAAFLRGSQTEVNAKNGNEVIYITDDMTWEQTMEILENRNGTTVIEIVVGVVEDDEGNGHTINTVRNQYIKYDESKFSYGDEVLTLFKYNPETNICDDIIDRHDFLVYDHPESEVKLNDIACLVSNADISLDEIYDIATENGYMFDNPTQMIDELVRMNKLYKSNFGHGYMSEDIYNQNKNNK